MNRRFNTTNDFEKLPFKQSRRAIVFYITLCFFYLLPPLAFSQDIKKDMQDMINFYNKEQSLSIDIRVSVYQDETSSSGGVQHAKIRKKGKNFLYELGEAKMLLSENALLMIYEKEKNIIYRTVTSKEYDEFLKNFITTSLDSVVAAYDSVNYKGNADNKKHYVVYTGKRMIAKTDLYINAATNALSKVVYHYNTDMWGSYYRVEIFFTNSTTSFSGEIFSEDKYITKTGSGYKLKPAYSNYHLIIADHED